MPATASNLTDHVWTTKELIEKAAAESMTVVSGAWSGTVRAFATTELVGGIQDAMKHKLKPTF